MQKNRILFIDVLKGFGIIVMVLGHMHFNLLFNKFIYAFHMPLFFSFQVICIGNRKI